MTDKLWQNLTVLQEITQKAATVFKNGDVEYWLYGPNGFLDGETPATLIERGDGEKVIALLDALADGVFA